MHTLDFLASELAHAERHLTRIRRIQAQMQSSLEAAGLDEVTVYERLIANKAHRQLQRDEAFYQQMCLRLQRHLSRQSLQTERPTLVPREAAKPATATAQPRVTPPTRNQPCPCGSTLKFKRCCGNPLRAARSAAA
jgi:uncharacterized protein YchJ